MKNVFFPDEVITKEDVFYVCSLIERIARRLKQPNRYVVNCDKCQSGIGRSYSDRAGYGKSLYAPRVVNSLFLGGLCRCYFTCI